MKKFKSILFWTSFLPTVVILLCLEALKFFLILVADGIDILTECFHKYEDWALEHRNRHPGMVYKGHGIYHMIDPDE